MKNRCEWCGRDPLYIAYHDDEWGNPIHDDQLLFEFLVLEGAQAGLSWLTILKKRENYRRAFHSFDCETVAGYSQRDVDRLLGDPAAIQNAQGVIRIMEEFGSLDSYLWSYVEGIPIQNEWASMAEIPAKTEISGAMSRDLKKRGLNFVGPTICYAFMQTVGMVNDHTTDCFRHEEINKLAQRGRPAPGDRPRR